MRISWSSKGRSPEAASPGSCSGSVSGLDSSSGESTQGRSWARTVPPSAGSAAGPASSFGGIASLSTVISLLMMSSR